MNDLIEHFGFVLSLLGIFAAASWYLLTHLMTRWEKKLDDLGSKFESFLMAVVTRGECEQKHDNLISLVSALLGCRNCNERNDK
jgi:hypothetical protein